MLGDNLQLYTYAYLMRIALAQVSENVDKRQGSITYDAAALACYVLAEAYQNMFNLVQETYILTAQGEWLENRALEFGITRYAATAATKRADFTDENGDPLAVPIGSRWTTISTTDPLTYVVTAEYVDGDVVPGAYQLECETPGTIGQEYTGPLIPITYLPGTVEATMSTTLIPGRNVETDDELRARYLARVNYRAFGGNIAQYREWLLEFTGIGACQIYPTWNGGGTVKCSIIDTTYRACSSDFISTVQNALDPIVLGEQGTGIGMAPIDHQVTVVTPAEVAINVSATISIDPEYTPEQFVDAVTAAIEEYLLDLRQAWGTGDDLNRYSTSVFLARVLVAIMSVPGIQNASNVTLNGSAADVVLAENATTQQIPIIGEVTLSAAT